jgi:large subunit ribosomal protein L1
MKKKHGKKYLLKKNKINDKCQYDLKNACNIIKNLSLRNFDESIDLIINTNILNNKNKKPIIGSTKLPHGNGKTPKIAVFAKGDDIKIAKTAGADYVGSEDLINIIKNKKLKINTVISSIDMMKTVSKFGKILGPMKLMPNPKMGTVSNNIKKTINNAKHGIVNFKSDKNGILHILIGKISFTTEKLIKNIETLIDSILDNKTYSKKENFIKKITISSTMSPSISIDVNQLLSKKNNK